MIKAVLFDVDGVLVDSLHANFLFAQDILKMCDKPIINKEEYQAHGFFYKPFKEMLRTLLELDSNEEAQEVLNEARRVGVRYQHEFVTVPENLSLILKDLKNKYKLGIASSRRRETIENIPQLKEIMSFFQTAIFIEDVINHKPHPEPLFLAAERLGVDPKECVYVGDAETDMHAAEAAGMYMITFASDVKGNATVSTEAFHELPELIEKLP